MRSSFLSHFSVQRLSGDAQQLGGLAHVAVAAIDHLAHMRLLQLIEGNHLLAVVDGIFQHPDQLVVVPGFGDEIGRAGLQAPHRQFHVGVGGD